MEPLAFFMLHRATYFGENYHAHINEIEMAYKFLLSNTPGMEQTGDIVKRFINCDLFH